jgi:hypothetical protein
VRQGLVEKADPGDSKKALYQIAERFFNIWYLMRASRRVRAKLRWFVEFLRVFFDEGDLEEMASEKPLGKILPEICDLILEQDSSNDRAPLSRAVALAQLGDFPRASVALEDALVGDPITLLALGRRELEVFFAAAVRKGRVRDCLELLDKKEWKDAWRPIYEALRAVESNSADYLKRVAVEIRDPALLILRRISPELPDTH